MKKDNHLVVLFAILVLLSGTLFILSNVILEDTKTIEIIIAIFLFVTGLGTYIYSKKNWVFYTNHRCILHLNKGYKY